MNSSFDKKANQLLRNHLTLHLSLKLKRVPTEIEIFEEFMALMDGKIKTDMELVAQAFEAKYKYHDYDNKGHRVDLTYADYKADMIELGYWESDEDRERYENEV